VLEMCDELPRSVVVVDNNMANLRDIRRAIEAFNDERGCEIPYLGINTRAYVEKIDNTVNLDRLFKQLAILEKEECYVPYGALKRYHQDPSLQPIKTLGSKQR